MARDEKSKAGNEFLHPDELDHWKRQYRWTLEELVCLVHGEKPRKRSIAQAWNRAKYSNDYREIERRNLPDISPKSKKLLEFIKTLPWAEYTDQIKGHHPDEFELPAKVGLTKINELDYPIIDGIKVLLEDGGRINELRGKVKELVESDHIMDQKTGPSTAKQAIIEYGEFRDQNGNPLRNADFKDPIQDETIINICKKYNRKPDTLRKHLFNFKLLAPSKTGPKTK